MVFIFINLHRGFFMLILWGVVSNCHCHCHDWWLGWFSRHAKHAALRIQKQSYWKAISTKVRVDAILLYSTGIAVAWLVEFLFWWSSTCMIGWCVSECIYCDFMFMWDFMGNQMFRWAHMSACFSYSICTRAWVSEDYSVLKQCRSLI